MSEIKVKDGSTNTLDSAVRKGIILMAIVGVARGSSFIFSKQLLANMEPMNLLALRALISFVILAIPFSKRIYRAIKDDIHNLSAGALIGLAYFLVMMMELNGLKYADSAVVSLIEHSAMVMVPLAEAMLLRRAPSLITMICSVLGMLGLGLVASVGPGSGLGKGELFSILAAVMYTAAIIITDRKTKKLDALVIGILLLGFMGSYAGIASLITESPHLPATQHEWFMLIMLILVCSCFGFTMQPVAQKYLSSETSGLFTAVNPLTAAVLGTLVLHEPFGPGKVIGAVLIIGSIVLHSLRGMKEQ